MRVFRYLQIFIFLSGAFVTPAFSQMREINLTATGYDWAKYSPDQKKELMGRILVLLKQDTGDSTVGKSVDALTAFYSAFLEECGNDVDHIDFVRCLHEPILKLMADLAIFEEENSPMAAYKSRNLPAPHLDAVIKR